MTINIHRVLYCNLQKHELTRAQLLLRSIMAAQRCVCHFFQQIILTQMLSRAISKWSRSISEIFASSVRVSLQKHSFSAISAENITMLSKKTRDETKCENPHGFTW